MKTVNSISGGKSSGYIAVHYPADYNVFSLVCIDDKRCTPKDQYLRSYVENKLAKYVDQFGEFIATAEDDKTITAMIDLEQLIGKEITWVRGLSFDSVIDEGTKTRLPSWARRYCTEKMKLLPIFLWWFETIGQKCNMRIGFRFDEVDRMFRFFNNSDPGNFKIPISCDTRGQRRQKHESFNWRFVDMPMVRDGITHDHVKEYWRNNGWLGGTLFDERRQIEWPVISNCLGCFHKSPELLAAISEISPEKFQWFISQEQKGMGTWLDSKVTYQHLFDNRYEIGKDVLFELKYAGSACDSSGCSD